MFQRKGKEHKRYIREIAAKSWKQSNGSIPFNACLIDALKQHREHIKKLLDANKHYYKSRNYSALND